MCSHPLLTLTLTLTLSLPLSLILFLTLTLPLTLILTITLLTLTLYCFAHLAVPMFFIIYYSLLVGFLHRVMGQSFSMVDSQEMRAQLLSIAQAVKQVRIEISSTFSCAVAHVDKLSHMAKLEEMQPGFPHPPVLHRNILPAAPSGQHPIARAPVHLLVQVHAPVPTLCLCFRRN